MSSVGTLSLQAGHRDPWAEIGTVPPKSGHLTCLGNFSILPALYQNCQMIFAENIESCRKCRKYLKFPDPGYVWGKWTSGVSVPRRPYLHETCGKKSCLLNNDVQVWTPSQKKTMHSLYIVTTHPRCWFLVLRTYGHFLTLGSDVRCRNVGFWT